MHTSVPIPPQIHRGALLQGASWLLHYFDCEACWGLKLLKARDAPIIPHHEGGGTAGTLIFTSDDERSGTNAQAISHLIREVLIE